MAYTDTDGASNKFSDLAEVIKEIIEPNRRIARAFGNFEDDRFKRSSTSKTSMLYTALS